MPFYRRLTGFVISESMLSTPSIAVWSLLLKRLAFISCHIRVSEASLHTNKKTPLAMLARFYADVSALFFTRAECLFTEG